MTQTNETLDRFLAEEVMGWTKWDIIPNVWVWVNSKRKLMYFLPNDRNKIGETVWHPTTDIAQAMMCAEKWCADNNGCYKLEGSIIDSHGLMFYRAVVEKWDIEHVNFVRGEGQGTRENAICLALYEAYCVSLVGTRDLTEEEQEHAMKIDLKPYEKYMKGGE